MIFTFRLPLHNPPDILPDDVIVCVGEVLRDNQIQLNVLDYTQLVNGTDMIVSVMGDFVVSDLTNLLKSETFIKSFLYAAGQLRPYVYEIFKDEQQITIIFDDCT